MHQCLSFSYSTPQNVRRDHPRARGEQAERTCLRMWAKGSSPRARGAVRLPDWSYLSDGIIPARAGSRRVRTSCAHISRDHPRARGEQRGMRYWVHADTGSSPRARGAVHTRKVGQQGSGIIPARAGSRHGVRRAPERARGAASDREVIYSMFRIIPARAGSRAP